MFSQSDPAHPTMTSSIQIQTFPGVVCKYASSLFSLYVCVCSCETLILLFLCSLKAFVVMNVCLNRQVSCSVYSQPALRNRNQLLTAITQTSSLSENLYEQSES